MALTNEVYDLVHSNQFKYEVMSRFAPEYAAAPLRELKESQFQERRRTENQKSNWTIMGMGLIMLALPFLYLMKGERKLKGNRKRNPDPNYPFQLPENLSVIKVFRKWIRLDFDCGLIYDKHVWTETVTTHYYRKASRMRSTERSTVHPGAGAAAPAHHLLQILVSNARRAGKLDAVCRQHLSRGRGRDDEHRGLRRKRAVCLQPQPGKVCEVRERHCSRSGHEEPAGMVRVPGGALFGTALLYFVVMPGTLNEDNADRAAFAVPIVLGVLSGMYIIG